MELVIKRAGSDEMEIIPSLFEKLDEDASFVNEQFFQDNRNILLIAYLGKVPCGFLYGYLLDSLNNRKPKLFLYSIDVFPEFQNRGIGTSLIEELKDIAKKSNCSEIFLITNDYNVAAKRLYEGTGAMRDGLDDIMYVYPIDKKAAFYVKNIDRGIRNGRNPI
ncbi:MULTISPECIES: GNAT family N-acetyltransferase [Bacillaceae]|uniref:GNAT family N-acetyltransferase n=1 Tax=Evansella alkalicola TaxID=745819 RepID=A0ABS6JWB6_9BACI|nr:MULTISPECIES: GNAT family N-acetyltransferase [Bacillaceae]MBU9722888.1 GNAT family N-acetyltransferase [Bacillus alkalicola]